MNLEALRRRRVKRLGAKSTSHTGQRRIFFVLDRAIQKFHGDVDLWMLYLDYARKQKSHKKVSEILTKMLRFHPTKPNLWIYAAHYALREQGDTMEARSFLQRGLRFCEGAQNLWLEYGRMEVVFIAKLIGRRRVLGLEDKTITVEQAAPRRDLSDDLVMLPSITAEELDFDQKVGDVDEATQAKLDDNSILDGALPIAVFDAAMGRSGNEQEFALSFFDMVAEFSQLPCQHTILNHIMTSLRVRTPEHPASSVCYIRLPVIGTPTNSTDFPSVLGTTLSRIRETQSEVQEPHARASLHHQIIMWLLLFLDGTDLDKDLRQVLELTVAKLWAKYQSAINDSPPNNPRQTAELLGGLEARGLKQISGSSWSWARDLWPENLPRYAIDDTTQQDNDSMI